MTSVLEEHRHIHFVGIGGIGMSALARMLLSQGYEISGSDQTLGDQCIALRLLGVPVTIGHTAQSVDGADLVVVTSAAGVDNPEILRASAQGIPVIKRSELLAAIMNPRHGIAVAGTHGKTTTSALISHLLIEGGLNPTVLIGGISANLQSNARLGGNLVVVEADEYDASFLHLRPAIAVITNVEPEHLDFYGSEEALHEAFRQFASQVRDLLVVCADDPVALDIARSTPADIVTYGTESGAWRASEIEERGSRLYFAGDHEGAGSTYEMGLAGMHNVRNALAAIAVADALHVPQPEIAQALAGFKGVGRRGEVLGEEAGVLVMDDYAHHPSEIRTVLQALRTRYRRPVRVVFQPHTYSRTKAFLSEFASAFHDADTVYLLDIYAAREKDTLGISGLDLANVAAQQHRNVVYAESIDCALDLLLADVQRGDLVITMGAGDVYQLTPRLLEGLANR